MLGTGAMANLKKIKVLILGGGSGGISVAARLSQKMNAGDIALVEPSQTHYYQPMWTLVAGGAADIQSTAKDMSTLIPTGVEWIQNSVSKITASKNHVELQNGDILEYQFLLVATGLTLNFAALEGWDDSLIGKNGLYSDYTFEGAPKTYNALNTFKGGTAIFVMPLPPIKCAGAPQKIMYLADEIFRRNGVREKTKIIFTTAGGGMFGIPDFKVALEKVVSRKSIEPKYFHKIVGINAAAKKAIFEINDPKQSPGTRVELAYDFLHLVPPMIPHKFILESDIVNKEGDQKNWMKVDKYTLQSPDFPNVFGVGDVTGVPNSKTGAAIRKMAPVVVENMISQMRGQPLTQKYDGYSSCPLVTGFGKVILAEFGYDSKLMPTFPFDQTQERRSMWILKKFLLPIMYWRGMLKGRA